MRCIYPLMFKINYSKVKYLIPIILLVILLLPSQADAQNPATAVLNAGASFLYDEAIIWFQAKLGSILAAIMGAFDWILTKSIGFYDVPVVNAGWVIMRDFANMFFIVALIIMAFATIFEVSKYSFSAMIVRFILTAVLINFSLPLSKLFLQFSDQLSHVFITALGSVANQLGQGIAPSVVPSATSLGSASSFLGGAAQLVITGVWGIILISMLIMSMGTATAFIFVRIPILWWLLIFAPIAMLLNIFPTTQKSFKGWLDKLIGWGLYLPVFLFFLYFGLYFLSRQAELVGAINSSSSGVPGAPTFQVIFSYFLACFFIWGGVKTAHEMSFLTSAKVIAWSDKPYQWIGLSGAWKKRKAQFQEEGLRGKFMGVNLDKIPMGPLRYGGRQGQERMEARWKGVFGNKGVENLQQRQFLDRVKKASEDVQVQIDAGLSNEDLAARAQGNASDPTVYAYRRVLAQRGQVDDKMFESTIKDLKDNQLAAQDFTKAAKEGDFSSIKDPDLLRIAANRAVPPPIRREMYSHIMSKPRIISQMDVNQLSAGLDVVGGPTSKSGKELLEAVGKSRPDRLIEYRFGVGLSGDALNNRLKETQDMYEKTFPGINLGDPADRSRVARSIYRGSIKGDAKETAGLHKDVWSSPDFQSAMEDYISKLPKTVGKKGGNKQANYINNLASQFAEDTRFGAEKAAGLRPVAAKFGVIVK